MVAVLLNSGCILTGPGQWGRNGFKVGPNYVRPPAPVAAEWIQANDPSVQNHHLQDWWQVFGDPTLDALIVTAYEQNPTLRIAGTRVLEARAGQTIAAGNIALNLVNVYRALGGGWELRCEKEPLQPSTESEHAEARAAPVEAPAALGPDSLPEALPRPRSVP